MTQEQIDKAVDINLTLHNKGYVRFNPPKAYFTNADIVKLQDFISDTFTNFNGGFGMSDTRDYLMRSIADNSIEFSFCVYGELRERVNSNQRNNVTYPYEFNQLNCVERFSWLELIIFLCDYYNVQFVYDPIIIDKIISKSKTTYDDYLISKYPLESLDVEMDKIRQLGYEIAGDINGCQIWLDDKLIIDADFYYSYHLNVAHAIDGFLTEQSKKK